MRYVVRSAEGELTFPSRQELLNAYRMGLVEAQDEIREEGATSWRQAAAVLGPRPSESRAGLLASPWRMGVLVAGASVALWLLLSGDLTRMAFGAVIALGLVMSMFSTTQRASQLRRRP
ncbi:MAG TPA: hypothetical protein VK013_04910 [Myxococcaceae bacterium]|nr:hypothetical protein [Myxococcaceae bacterium]